MMDEIALLPVHAYLDEIAGTLKRSGMLLLRAEPGAGKTTLVPWRLLSRDYFARGKMLLLQPRRIAARAAAEQIARLLGERIGESVGLRTRIETITGPMTRLEVVTEGVVTRILQNDPALSEYSLVIFDEFHERNLPGDIALAFTLECREVFRPDLKLLFMSATPPEAALSAALGEMPLIDVPGRAWPVAAFDLPPLPGETPWRGAARLALEAQSRLAREGTGGDTLVFLPGMHEILRTREELVRISPELAPHIALLHGRLPAEEQRRVLRAPNASSQRIILATNVAETSLTIPGVRAVVDSGLERRVAFHPRTGMDHWETVEISEASARQRQGRAGRLGPGICLRWRRPETPRRSFSPPEIQTADLAPLVLETALWGAASPLDLQWITPPPAGALKQATELLTMLEMIDRQGQITAFGRHSARLGLHPRLGRMVMVARKHDWLATAALAAAILEEGDSPGGDDPDFRDRLSAWGKWNNEKKGGIRQGAAERIGTETRRIIRLAGAGGNKALPGAVDPSLAGKLLLLAYPERAAQRVGASRVGEAARFVLATGRGAKVNGSLAREDFLVAADLDGGDTEARVFLAAPITRTELEAGLAGQPEEVHLFSWEGWIPRRRTEIRIGRLVLSEKTAWAPQEDELRQAVRARLREEGIGMLPWNDASRRFLARCRFAGRYGNRKEWPDFSEAALWDDVDAWLIPQGNWNGKPVFTETSFLHALSDRLGWQNLRALELIAPESLSLPSGTNKRIDYETGEIPVVAARLQEFFGCRETPRVSGEPVLLHLLSPAGRPMQITRDLDGFWDRVYPAVKKELMGRYPRHHWPDDPRVANPTARAKSSLRRG